MATASATDTLDWRYLMDMLELVEAERARIRGASDPAWPDALWHDYRVALVLVQHQLQGSFATFPESPPAAESQRTRERIRWLVLLAKDVRAVVEATPERLN